MKSYPITGTIADLPMCCALVAMAACYQLASHGLTCKPIAIVYSRKPLWRHVVTVIYFGGRLRVYDNLCGCVTLPRTITEKSSAPQIARAWKKQATEFSHNVLGAEWY